jgi:Ca2+/Na+ antiporter
MAEIMSKLSTKLKEHVWCVIFFMGLLMFWLAAFIYYGKGSDWVSWLSILLAVIVVVYMFLQTHRSEQNLSEMRHLISEGQQLITEKAGVLAEKASSIEVLVQSLEQLPAQNIASQGALKETTFELDVSGLPGYPLLVLYSLVKAQNQKKLLSLRALASIAASSEAKKDREYAFNIAYSMTSGLINGLQCFLREITWAKGSRNKFRVKTLPASVESHILSYITVFKKLEDPHAKTYFEEHTKKIDAYFEADNNSQE